jgi:hypothetical protein
VRAVFWRLCRAGIKPKGCAESDGSKPQILAYQLVVGRMLELHGRPAFDSAPIPKELVEAKAVVEGKAFELKARALFLVAFLAVPGVLLLIQFEGYLHGTP